MSVEVTPTASVTVPNVTTVEATPELPSAALMTTPLPVTDLGTCDDCGADLEIHCSRCNASYCESCEYGN